MAQNLTKTIVLSNFYGGQAETDLDIYARDGEAGYVQSADLFRSNDFLRPQLDMANDGTGFSGAQGLVPRIQGYVKNPATNVIYCKIYRVDTDPTPDEYGPQLFRKSTLTDSWTLASLTTTVGTRMTTTDSTEHPFGLWVRPTGSSGEVFYASRGSAYSTSARAIGLFDVPNDTETIEWDDLDSTAWGGDNGQIGGAVYHTDGNMYFWKTDLNGVGGRYIGAWDGTTKPDSTTPFSIPVGYSIVDTISYGHYLLCAANSSSSSATSKLFLIDPYSNYGFYTFDDIYDTGTYEIQKIQLVEGGVKILTALGDYYIWDWAGGNTFFKEKRLNVRSTSGFSVRPTACDVRDNIWYFGTNNSVSGFNNGIYAYGREKQENPKILHNAYVYHGDDVSSVDYRAIKWISDGDDMLLYSSQYDGTTYTCSRLSTARDISNFIYESLFFRPWRNLRSQCIKATFYHEALGASDRFALNWKVDDPDNSFTEIDTAVGTTSDVETVLRNNMAGLTNNFLNGFRHKLRYTITGGEPRIEAIKLTFRSNSIIDK